MEALKKKEYYAHESCYIDEPCEIGSGTKIWHFSHIMKGCKIGKDCKFGQNVHVAANVIIGNNVKIQNNVSVYTGVTLEDDVFCGPSMVFTNILNPRSAYPRNTEDVYAKTLVKKGASIGANATVVCGTTIGRHAFIGAGTVATKDIPDYALVYGNPAKIMGYMCECGVKLKFEDNVAICTECKKEYEKTGINVTKKN